MASALRAVVAANLVGKARRVAIFEAMTVDEMQFVRGSGCGQPSCVALVEVMVPARKFYNMSHIGELTRKLGDTGHRGFVRRLRRLPAPTGAEFGGAS